MARFSRELATEEFLAAIRRGDSAFEQAVSDLYRAEYPKLLRAAMRRVGDRATAEGLLQEAFLKFINCRHQYRGDSPPAGYIYQTLINLTNDHLVRRIREMPFSEFSAEDEDEPMDFEPRAEDYNPQCEPDRQAEHARLVHCIKQVMEHATGMNADYVLVFELIYCEGLKPAALAERLGRTPGATRQLIFACKRKLQGIFAPCYELLRGDREDPAHV